MIKLAGLILAVAVPCWAVPNDAPAIREAQSLAKGGQTVLRVGYDGGAGASGQIGLATAGALKTGGLTVTETIAVPAVIAEVPAPTLGKDAEGAKSKKGGSFFDNLFSNKGLMFGLGGAAIGGVAGFLIGGLPGALIGAAIGAIAGFLLSKFLS